jgi:multidrug efflux pump subunit AcrA (membrane-fusion protein)
VLGTIAALPGGTIPDPPPFVPNPSDPPETQAAKQAAYDQQAAADAPYRPQPSESTGMRVVCRPPDGTRLISGADATVEVITASATNVLVLPVAAVAGREGTGQVTVVLPDGSTEIRSVTLGLTDGEYIEIKSGLTGDETIAVPGPNLPPGQGGDGGGKTGGPLVGVVPK